MHKARMGRAAVMRGWQYCPLNLLANLITLINPDLQDMKNKKFSFNFLHRRSTVHCPLLLVLRMLSVRWNRFRACSACDEILSAYAQHAVKSFPSMLSVRWNRFPVYLACGEIVSPYAQHANKSFPRLLSMRSDGHVKTVEIS
jgi:hypothetical protein